MLLIPIKSSYDDMIKKQIDSLLENELNITNNLKFWIDKFQYEKKYGNMFIQLNTIKR